MQGMPPVREFRLTLVSSGWKVSGKFFAFSKKGAMIVKLPKVRVADLVTSRRRALPTLYQAAQ
jgi:hypothetical protein